ncbi:MAG: hypothetical protein JST80_11105 [Bdellovibrionales bacterium]|nr:hypothetical protein [Bdellovibrionales bacterium]
MKSLLAVLVAGLFSALSFAATVKIDCAFLDPEFKDHILVEILSEQRGTFYYSSEADTHTGATPTDKLDLKRTASPQRDLAKWISSQTGVNLYFVMPADLTTRASEAFKGTFISEIPDLNMTTTQDLKCSSKI